MLWLTHASRRSLVTTPVIHRIRPVRLTTTTAASLFFLRGLPQLKTKTERIMATRCDRNGTTMMIMLVMIANQC